MMRPASRSANSGSLKNVQSPASLLTRTWPATRPHRKKPRLSSASSGTDAAALRCSTLPDLSQRRLAPLRDGFMENMVAEGVGDLPRVWRRYDRHDRIPVERHLDLGV